MRLHLAAAFVGLALLNACAPPLPAQRVACATLASNPATYTGSRVSVRVRNMVLARSGTADGHVESNTLWRCVGDHDDANATLMTRSTGTMGGPPLVGETWAEGAADAVQSSYPPDFVIEGVARDVRTHRFGNDEYSALFIEHAHIAIAQEADTTLPPAPPMAAEPAPADPPLPPAPPDAPAAPAAP